MPSFRLPTETPALPEAGFCLGDLLVEEAWWLALIAVLGQQRQKKVKIKEV